MRAWLRVKRPQHRQSWNLTISRDNTYHSLEYVDFIEPSDEWEVVHKLKGSPLGDREPHPEFHLP